MGAHPVPDGYEISCDPARLDLDAVHKFLLASYYLDGRKLHEIAAVLGVHEATISRKLKRATAAVRKQIVRRLEQRGMNRRQVEEVLEADPRDFRIRVCHRRNAAHVEAALLTGRHFGSLEGANKWGAVSAGLLASLLAPSLGYAAPLWLGTAVVAALFISLKWKLP